MVNLFGALDTTEIPEFPEDGTHDFILKNLKPVTTQSGDHKLVMEFHLDEDGSPFHDNKWTKWFNLPWLDSEVESIEDFEPDMVKAYNTLKKWLIAIGVPEDEIGNFEPSDYTGTRVSGYGKVVEKYNQDGREWMLMTVKREA